MKYSFKNDYSEGAHPRILDALVENNLHQEPGYGLDSYSLNTVKYMKKAVEDDKACVHLISGGTQTNLIAIRAFLRPHQACIAAESGHIAVHEAGAIEASGHKICTVATRNGKLTCDHIQSVLQAHTDEHMVSPKLVYISNPTELGTVYTKSEIKDLRAFCLKNDLLLYCDGARLGTVLCQPEYGLTLKDMYELTDAFFIGGTKNGALLGEILLIQNDELNQGMRHIIKQSGGMLAKGRLIGIQFETLFRDRLFYELSQHAMTMAKKLSRGFEALGYAFLVEPQTNQIFPILENDLIADLEKSYDFYVWEEVNKTHSAVRLVTSWATQGEAIKTLLSTVEDYKKSKSK